MDDYIYKGRIEGLDIAFSICLSTGLVQDEILRHDCDPISAHLLGRALTAGLLAAGLLGENERLNVHWKYGGNLRTLVVDAGADATARGLISPTDLSSYEDETQSIYGDSGRLHVVRSRRDTILSSSATSSVHLEVVDDLAHFLSTSDQVETGLSVMIGFNRDIVRPINLCQGFLIQALPHCDLARFDAIRRRLGDPEVRRLLAHESEADNFFEVLINTLVRPITSHPRIHVSDRGAPRFRCMCSRDKMTAVLRAIPESDRREIIDRREDLVVHCRFCTTRYVLSIEEATSVWDPTERS